MFILINVELERCNLRSNTRTRKFSFGHKNNAILSLGPQDGYIRWWNVADQVTLYKQAYPASYPGHLLHVICVGEL